MLLMSSLCLEQREVLSCMGAMLCTRYLLATLMTMHDMTPLDTYMDNIISSHGSS